MAERQRLEFPDDSEFEAKLPPELSDAPKRDQIMYLQMASLNKKIDVCMRHAIDAYNMGVDAEATIQSWRMTPTKILVGALSIVSAAFLGVMVERIMHANTSASAAAEKSVEYNKEREAIISDVDDYSKSHKKKSTPKTNE